MDGTKKHDMISKGYGNAAMHAPDGTLMFYTGGRKLEFYLKNDLAENIGENNYILKFQPKGLGHAKSSINSDDSDGVKSNIHCLRPRQNICVVSGSDDMYKINRHHIVPRFFRRHMPPKYKYNFQLVVLIDKQIHSDYTILEQKFYDHLSEKYDTQKWDDFREIKVPNSLVKLAKSLFLYSDRIPADRLLEMKMSFQVRSGLAPTLENYRKVAHMDTLQEGDKKERTIYSDFGKALMSKVTDFDEFERLWLNHFVTHTNPKFLPDDLKLTYNL